MLSKEEGILQEFIRNSESTMTPSLSCSVSTALFKLQEIYLQKKNIDILYKTVINEIAEFASKQGLSNLLDFILKILEQPPNALDQVTLFLPKEDNPSHFENQNYCYPLEEVLTLVWIALTDLEVCKQYLVVKEGEDKNKALLDLYQARLNSFFNCLTDLQNKPVCHHGTRNELVFLLNKIHPAVDLIEDPRSTILSFLKEEINKRFVELYAKNSCNTQQHLKAAIIAWFSNQDTSQMIKHLDPENTLRTSLHSLFIKHGVNPQAIQLDRLIDASLSTVTFSCDPQQYPQLFYAHLILHEFACHPSRPKFQQKALAWLKTYLESQAFKFENVSDIECLQTFCLFFQSYEAYIENSSLLKYAYIPPSVTQFIKKIENYFEEISQTQRFPKTICSEDAENNAVILETIQKIKKDNYHDEIENFFWRYFDAIEQLSKSKYLKREQIKKMLRRQYHLLLNIYFQEKVILGDDEIQTFYQTQQQGILPISAYELNRIFLHAILCSPSEWTPLFAELFTQAFHFTQKNFDNNHSITAKRLKRESYPNMFLTQLHYLLKKYQAPLSLELEEPPKRILILPSQVHTAKEWIEIAEYLIDPEDLQKHYQPYATLINLLLLKEIKENKNPTITFLCLKSLANSALDCFFRRAKEDLFDAKFWDFKSLNYFINHLAQENREFFLKFLLKEKGKFIEFLKHDFNTIKVFFLDFFKCYQGEIFQQLVNEKSWVLTKITPLCSQLLEENLKTLLQILINNSLEFIENFKIFSELDNNTLQKLSKEKILYLLKYNEIFNEFLEVFSEIMPMDLISLCCEEEVDAVPTLLEAYENYKKKKYENCEDDPGYYLLRELNYRCFNTTKSPSLLFIKQLITDKFYKAQPGLLQIINSNNFFKIIESLAHEEIIFLWIIMQDRQEEILGNLKSIEHFSLLSNALSLDFYEENKGNFTELIEKMFKLNIFATVVRTFDDYLEVLEKHLPSQRLKYHFILVMQDSLSQLIEQNAKLNYSDLCAYLSHLSPEECRVIARNNKQKIINSLSFLLSPALGDYLCLYRDKKNFKITLTAPDAYWGYYSSNNNAIILLEEHEKIIIKPLKQFPWNYFQLILNDQEKKALKFPAKGEASVIIKYNDNPNLFRALFKQTNFELNYGFDLEQWQAIIDEISDDNLDFISDIQGNARVYKKLHTFPPPSLLDILKKLNKKSLLQFLDTFLSWHHFALSENSIYRNQLLSHCKIMEINTTPTKDLANEFNPPAKNLSQSRLRNHPNSFFSVETKTINDLNKRSSLGGACISGFVEEEFQSENASDQRKQAILSLVAYREGLLRETGIKGLEDPRKTYKCCFSEKMIKELIRFEPELNQEFEEYINACIVNVEAKLTPEERRNWSKGFFSHRLRDLVVDRKELQTESSHHTLGLS